MLSSSSTIFQNSQVSHSLNFAYPLNKPIPSLLRNKVLQFHPQGLPNPISEPFPPNAKVKLTTSPPNHQIPETITYEPVKKVKPSPPAAEKNQQHSIIQTEKSSSRFVTLTVEDVWSQPKDAFAEGKNAEEDEESVELSFLSSNESDNINFEEYDLNLNKPIEEEDNDCIVISPPTSKKVESQVAHEPLVVQDKVFANIKPLIANTLATKNYTNDLKYNAQTLKQSVEFNFLGHYNNVVPIPRAKVQLIPQPVVQNQPLTIDYFTTFQPLSANIYPQNNVPKEFFFGSREPAKIPSYHEEENKNLLGKRPNQWDGRNDGVITLSDSENDVDSNDTGSTSLGLESRNLSALESEKIQKELSPFSGSYTNIFDDEKPQKRGRGRPRKGEIVDKKDKKIDRPHKPKPTNLVLQKQKSNNSSANLNVNKNPTNRGLNKLQLLRYQNTLIEEEEYDEEEVIQKVSISPFGDAEIQENESCDRDQSVSNGDSDDVNALIDFDGQATIPPFSQDTQSRRRRVLNPVWNPEKENQTELEVYLAQISEVIEFPVTNQEKAFKLLKSFNMNIESLLEVVKEDVPLYRELFKVKANKLRGCRINGRSLQF